MCGIVGVIGNTPCTEILLNGLSRLEYRGYDSAGISVLDSKGNRVVLKATGNVSQLRNKISNEKLPLETLGTTGIAHTRWATHGKVTESNAHPHLSNNIAVVHNGIIENHGELREQLVNKGYQFRSETDTEVLACLLHDLQKQTPKIVDCITTLTKVVTGAYGLVVQDLNTPDQIVVARSGSPMVIGINEHHRYVASDTLALHPYTENFIYLEEGEFAVLKESEHQVFSQRGAPVEKQVFNVPREKDDGEKNGYDTFMEKEMSEQPAIVGRLIRQHMGDTAGTFNTNSDVHKISKALASCKHLHLVACGTSYHASLVAKDYFEKYLNIPTSVEIASEYRYRSVAVPEDSAFICVSQSGETADTLAALRKAKELPYLTTLTLCNVATSSMVREAHHAFYLNAGVEIGVASTKAFTTQLTAFLLITLSLVKDHETCVTLHNDLLRLSTDCERMLTLGREIERKAAPIIAKVKSCLFLGRGQQSVIAMEGALKLKELSYIHAEAYAAGELKHGPLALIDDDMPLVVTAPKDDTIDKLAANIEEVNARGGLFVVFAEEGVDLHGESITVIRTPSVPLSTAAITYALPLQLLSFYVTLLLGNNVDQPRSLAKSVSVE